MNHFSIRNVGSLLTHLELRSEKNAAADAAALESSGLTAANAEKNDLKSRECQLKFEAVSREK